MRKREDVEKLAKRNKWILNPNDKVVKGNLRVQNINIEKNGFPYCPCKPDKIEENICGDEAGCKDCAQEIKDMGHCTCNLYFDPHWDNK